ncbi:serine/threonine protein kinase [Amycolatopsis sp. cmx-4-54]|uniref:serine/threonine protein kinase n=1 Tax=Amycolatopsis sp. cmx-4-54 TaxID=2790936 RepID=UPI00397D1B78
MSTIVPGPGDTVLKVYPGSLDRETRAALDRERAALSGIASILPVEEIGKLADGRTALRMPRCDRSLATLAEPLPIQDALIIGETVARALSAAHRAGVVHGSVSPGNVLIRRTGEPVVADFGLALRRRFPRDPLHGLEFAAPETVRDQTMDERTDRYGLGAVLYLALTGYPPHRTVVGEQPGTRIHRVLTEPVAPITRPEVPDELVTLVGDLLAKDPESRPEDPEARLKHLHRKLAAAQAGIPLDLPAEPILVLEPTRPERPPPETAASKRKYGIAAAILAVICGAVAVPWLLSGGGEAPSVPPATTAPPSSGVEIHLAPPVDHETSVDLSWTSNAELDFAIILAEEGRAEPQVILTQRTKQRRIEVRPGLRYCFQIQGSSPQGTYESEFQPLRGAVCKP